MITRKDCFKEVISPKEFEKSEDNKFLWCSMYKAMYMGIRLLLDIRTNQKRIAEKLGFKLEEPKDDVPTE